jgi:hypothetical protein
MPALPLEEGTDDWRLVKNALLRKEGYWNMPGVEWTPSNGLVSMNQLGYKDAQIKRINVLVDKKDDIDKELRKVLDLPAKT